MSTIQIQLPTDRTVLGQLKLIAGDGTTVLAGPFNAYGKAANDTAAMHGNAGADPLHLYGDTPLGSYTKGPKNNNRYTLVVLWLIE